MMKKFFPIFFIAGMTMTLAIGLAAYAKEAFGISHAQAMLIELAYFGGFSSVCLFVRRFVFAFGYRTLCEASLLVLIVAYFGVAASLFFHVFISLCLCTFCIGGAVCLLEVCGTVFVQDRSKALEADLTLAHGFTCIGMMTSLLFTSQEALALVWCLYAFGIAGFCLAWKSFRVEEIALKESERAPIVLWPIFGLILYVGAEIGVGTFIIKVAQEQLSYNEATRIGVIYWFLLGLGRFLEQGLLRKFDGKIVGAWHSIAAALLIFLATCSSFWTTLVTLCLSGYAFSLVFPLFLAYGLGRSKDPNTVAFLCMANIGGGVLPVMQGAVADAWGLAASFFVPSLASLLCAALFMQRQKE